MVAERLDQGEDILLEDDKAGQVLLERRTHDYRFLPCSQ